MLNKEQKGAAEDLDGTSIIVAGAGTGKTQTLIHKLVNLINKGVDPARICLLTFTNDAANTMKARAMALGAKNIERLTACTYHSFCDRLMRRYNHLINRPNDYAILEPSMVCDIISMHMSNYKPDLKKQGITKFPSAKALAGMYSAAINQDVPLRDIVESSASVQKICGDNAMLFSIIYKTICDIKEDVEEYKTMKKMKDFDDLLLGAHDLLNDKTVRDMVNVIYQYILIDEYQDTNHIQAEIVHLLRDSNVNLVVVGDDFQSIYKFRGAEVKNFTDFPNEFANVKQHTLVQNYRSTQEILDLANRVMDCHAKFGFKKNLVTGKNKHGSKPVIYAARDQRQEADLACALLRKYRLEDDANGKSDSKVAVLYRGSGSAVYLEGELTKRDIPYEKHGGTAFFDLDCVQDVLSYLRLIANPFHTLAWFRVLKIYGHIGDKRAADMAAMSTTLGFLSQVPQRRGKTKTAVEINEDLTQLEEVLDAIKEEETSHDMLKVVIDHYKKVYERRCEHNESMEESKDTVFTELDLLLMLSDDPEYEELNKWLDATTLREVDKPKGDGRLILSTVHSAKGLEWDHVIILDCADDIFPRAETQDEMDEELRCFYVAMTRAADTLDIIYPKTAMVFGKMGNMAISPFLQGIGAGYADVIECHKNKDAVAVTISQCEQVIEKYETEQA